MTISRKLVLAFLGLGIGVSALSVIAVAPLEGGLAEIGTFHMPALLTIRGIQSELNGAVQESFAYVITGEPSEREQYAAHVARADVLLEEFRAVAKLDRPGEDAEAAMFKRIVTHRLALERAANAMFEVRERGEPIPLEIFDAHAEMMEALSADLAELTAVETAEVREAQHLARKLIHTAERWLLTIGGIAIGLSVIVGVYIAGRITRPLRTLQAAASSLGEGRMSPIDVEGHDEIAELTRSFNAMAAEVAQARATLERRYQDLYERAPVGILELDETLRIRDANPAGRHMLASGEKGGVIGRTLAEIAENVDVAAILDSTRTGRTADVDLVVGTPGAERSLFARFTVIASADARRPRLMAIIEDVTHRRELERRQKLMVRELDHRVKNNLASVLALANQSIGDATTLPEFRAAFAGRLHAMARTHEALAVNHWGGVDLAWTIERTLEPYAGGDHRRVRTSGPPVRLAATMVSPLGLALHELATNSAKYGALSQGGTVDVRWTALDATLHTLHWTERGGPPVEGPVEFGTGLRLIKGLVHHELRGDVELDFAPDGLRCTMQFPGRDRAESAHTVGSAAAR